MAPKPTAASAEAVQNQMKRRGVAEVDTWGTWERGQTVGIEGEAGKFKIMGFRLGSSGDLVTVVGGPVWGPNNVNEFRSFDAARLTTKIVKRARTAWTGNEEETECQ